MVQSITNLKNLLLHYQKSIVAILLTLITIIVFFQITNHDFVEYDDITYLVRNENIHDGLTWEGIKWAFTTFRGGNWHPLTWISHMLDIELFGLKPGWHHLVSLCFHIINTLLLFIVFFRMTGEPLPSAFVAALFAIHPLHIQSVAWASERKDVLCTVFFFLTILSYIRYVDNPALKRYVPVFIFHLLGLMAKPMLVTLPCVLLLLDYWPLHRIDFDNRKNLTTPRMIRLLVEKIPLLILSAIFSYITVLAQQHAGALRSYERFSVGLRIANAFIAYIRYIFKTFLPINLSALYPFPEQFPVWQVLGAFILFALICLFVLFLSKRFRYLSVGWFWYVGTLIPTIGLVQVGSQAMADRYTYIPLIGIFIIIAWAGIECIKQWPYLRRWIFALAISIIVILVPLSYSQVGVWKNSDKLFTNILDVTKNTFITQYTLGDAFFILGQIDKAIKHYNEAIKIDPSRSKAYAKLGDALLQKNRLDEAERIFTLALKLDPKINSVHNNLGHIMMKKGQIDEAIHHFYLAVESSPKSEISHFNYGSALMQKNNMTKATFHLSEAIRINPNMSEAHNNLGIALGRQKRYKEAINHFKKALIINPDYEEARLNLTFCLKLEKEEIDNK